MKIQIKLEYLDKIYLSCKEEMTKNELDIFKQHVTEIAEGTKSYLVIKSELEEYYFTQEILKLSIITLIVT